MLVFIMDIITTMTIIGFPVAVVTPVYHNVHNIITIIVVVIMML